MSAVIHKPDATSPHATGCPIDHSTFSYRKTLPMPASANTPLKRDPQGVWHVRGYTEARAILRSTKTKQAGFRAELIERMPGKMQTPILYQEGQVHHQQRKQTARFFTPKATSENYRQLMEQLADQMIAKLQRDGRADLSELSMRLAVSVAGQVIGLTNSLVPGMSRRIDAFFTNDTRTTGRPRSLFDLARNRLCMLAFHLLDVRPAIKARRRSPQEDLISHLIAQNYNDASILTECVTYGAAGMATTREFISAAAWHFLEQPVLRDRYLRGSEEERHALLQEVLRLEPVVGHLLRRTTDDLEIESQGHTVTIPAGDLIDIHVYEANADEAVVGDDPHQICPARSLPERIGPALMSFGDGHHRCPGAYVAIQESDIFLQRLLAIEGLRIAQMPSLTRDDVVKGYKLRNFIITYAAERV
jgi:cytochrome P450